MNTLVSGLVPVAEPIDQVLEAEIRKGEVRLCEIMLGVTLLAGLLLSLLAAQMGAALGAAVVRLALVAALYFVSLRCVLMLRAGGSVWIRYVSAFAEPTFVSLAIYTVSKYQSATWAFGSPAFGLYALVLAISVCRLRPLLMVYTAALAGAQYLCLYYQVLAPQLAGELAAPSLLIQPWVIWERTFWLLASGGVLAFALTRMRAVARLEQRRA